MDNLKKELKNKNYDNVIVELMINKKMQYLDVLDLFDEKYKEDLLCSIFEHLLYINSNLLNNIEEEYDFMNTGSLYINILDNKSIILENLLIYKEIISDLDDEFELIKYLIDNYDYLNNNIIREFLVYNYETNAENYNYIPTNIYLSIVELNCDHYLSQECIKNAVFYCKNIEDFKKYNLIDKLNIYNNTFDITLLRNNYKLIEYLYELGINAESIKLNEHIIYKYNTLKALNKFDNNILSVDYMISAINKNTYILQELIINDYEYLYQLHDLKEIYIYSFEVLKNKYSSIMSIKENNPNANIKLWEYMVEHEIVSKYLTEYYHLIDAKYLFNGKTLDILLKNSRIIRDLPIKQYEYKFSIIKKIIKESDFDNLEDKLEELFTNVIFDTKYKIELRNENLIEKRIKEALINIGRNYTFNAIPTDNEILLNAEKI